MSQRIIAQVLLFASGLAVARTLGAEGRGLSSLFFLIPVLFASLGSFGVPEALLYQAARGRNGIAAHLWAFFPWLALIGLAAAWACSSFLPGADLPPWACWLAWSLIPVLVLRNLVEGWLRGKQRIQVGLTTQTTTAAVRTAGILGALACGGGIEAVWVAIAVSEFVGAAALFAAAGRTLWERPRLERETTGELARYAGSTFWGALAQRLNLRIDQVLLVGLLGPFDLGLYTMAIAVAAFLLHVPDAIALWLHSRVAQRGGEAAEEVARCLRVTLCALAVGALLLAALSGPIMGVFGPAFGDAHWLLCAVLPGTLCLAGSKVVSKYHSGVGRPGRNSRATLLALGISTGLHVALIPLWGPYGAAAAHGIGQAAMFACLFVPFLRASGLPCDVALRVRARDLRDVWERVPWQAFGGRVRRLIRS